MKETDLTFFFLEMCYEGLEGFWLQLWKSYNFHIFKLKNNKTPDENYIAAEMINVRGRNVEEGICNVEKWVWEGKIKAIRTAVDQISETV